VRTAEDLIDTYRQLIARAHMRGIKIIGCTLMPFEGVTIPGYYSETKETERQKVKQWIRSSGAFDGVIDFDQVMRDPEHPSRLGARSPHNLDRRGRDRRLRSPCSRQEQRRGTPLLRSMDARWPVHCIRK
jgi:hypothetical protein